MLIAGCAGTTHNDDPTSAGKYEQTWATSYSDTTCADWNATMNEHQRWVAAADMLVGARKAWKIDSVPSDSLVNTFEADISENCDLSTMTNDHITDVATGLTLIGGKAQYGG